MSFIRIGTRESELAVWQANSVKGLLLKEGIKSELVYIKSDGDIDLVTPLYEIGVQGIFTKTLDAALLNNRIDIAVHSMKDVPTQMAKGIVQAAVLKRASYKDLLVYKIDSNFLEDKTFVATIATSSIRRKSQWIHNYPNHKIENLRGNVNTRLKKVQENDWHGAIFAAAGLERINLRPKKSIELDWMLPAPAQGAIMIACRDNDNATKEKCLALNDSETSMCTRIEREFLRTLLGGCSTPVSALAERKNDELHFRGNIFSLDGKEKIEIEKHSSINDASTLGINAANELLKKGAKKIVESIRNAR